MMDAIIADAATGRSVSSFDVEIAAVATAVPPYAITQE